MRVTARRIALVVIAISASMALAGPANAGPRCNEPAAHNSAVCFIN